MSCLKEENLSQIYTNLREFMSLFHQKFDPIYRKDDDIKYKCNKNQIKVIMLIGKKERTSTELGKCLDMRKGSLTTLIDSLEKKHLVFRESDKDDRRKTWIYLTAEGKNYLEQKKQQMKYDIMQLFDSLTEKEQNEFKDSMETIVNILKKL